MSEIQKKFQTWLDAERKKGLVDIKFFYGDLSGATVDSFLEEFMEVNAAIVAGKYTPFPEAF